MVKYAHSVQENTIFKNHFTVSLFYGSVLMKIKFDQRQRRENKEVLAELILAV